MNIHRLKDPIDYLCGRCCCHKCSCCNSQYWVNCDIIRSATMLSIQSHLGGIQWIQHAIKEYFHFFLFTAEPSKMRSPSQTAEFRCSFICTSASQICYSAAKHEFHLAFRSFSPQLCFTRLWRCRKVYEFFFSRLACDLLSFFGLVKAPRRIDSNKKTFSLKNYCRAQAKKCLLQHFRSAELLDDRKSGWTKEFLFISFDSIVFTRIIFLRICTIYGYIHLPFSRYFVNCYF